MSANIRKSLAFAVFPLLMAMVSDLLFTNVACSAHMSNEQLQLLGAHAVFWVAAFVLPAVGAFVALSATRKWSPSGKAVRITGQLFSIATFFIVVFAFTLGGIAASAIWLLVGGFAFVACAPLIQREKA